MLGGQYKQQIIYDWLDYAVVKLNRDIQYERRRIGYSTYDHVFESAENPSLIS